RRHTRSKRDWSSDVCSSDLVELEAGGAVLVGWVDVHGALGWGGGGVVAVVQPLHQGVEAAAEAVFVHAQVPVGDGVVEFGEVVGGQGAAAAQDEGEPACGQGAGVEQGQQLGQVGGGCAGVC